MNSCFSTEHAMYVPPFVAIMQVISGNCPPHATSASCHLVLCVSAVGVGLGACGGGSRREFDPVKPSRSSLDRGRGCLWRNCRACHPLTWTGTRVPSMRWMNCSPPRYRILAILPTDRQVLPGMTRHTAVSGPLYLDTGGTALFSFGRCSTPTCPFILSMTLGWLHWSSSV
jgi:hypothetical protein